MESIDIPSSATLAQKMVISEHQSIIREFSIGIDIFLSLMLQKCKARAKWLRAEHKLKKTFKKMLAEGILIDREKAQAMMSDLYTRLLAFLMSGSFGTDENAENAMSLTTAIVDLAAEVLQDRGTIDAQIALLPLLPPSALDHNSVALSGSPNSNSGPKVIFHVIRHGQATHNIAERDAHLMFDPPLTPVGEAQCESVASTFPDMEKISLVLCSPSYRTRQTAQIGFKPLFDLGIKMHLWNKLKEWGRGPCNSGWNKDVLMFMNDPKCNLGMLEMDWNTAEEVGNYRHNRADADRSKDVRRELHNLSKALLDGGKWHHLDFPMHTGENNIEVLIVSHGDFLSHLLRLNGPLFHNAQYRTVQFPTETDLAVEGLSWKADDLVVAGLESIYNPSLQPQL